MHEVRVRIRDFLTRFFRECELKDDADIFSLGFVNSLFALQLVEFLEREFDIKMENEDLDLDKFRTINKLVNLVDSKTLSNR